LVFAGLPEGGDAVWFEAVYGLEIAKRRMREIAEQRPGVYFLCERAKDVVIDRVDTAPRPKFLKQAKRGAA
jgi:hypothetical protein